MLDEVAVVGKPPPPPPPLPEAGELVVAKLVELQEAAEVVVEAAAFA